MRRIRRLISKSIFARTLALALGSVLVLSSCSSAEKRSGSDQLVQKYSFQKIFFYPFDSVWRAAQLALRYPIAINNMDNGILETDWIRGVDGFIPPQQAGSPSPGLRYKVQLALVKGKTSRQESVRVTIIKKLEKQRDFFSDPEGLETDGLEEKILFYRIERELIIEEALKKAVKTAHH